MERAKPMKRTRLFKTGLITLICLGLIVPGPLFQAMAAGADSKLETCSDEGRAPAVVDVALYDGGTLQGQVVDAQGKALAEVTVSIQQGDREIRRTVTDRSGRFRVAKLRGGTYRIVADEAVGVYRLWAPSTAPPSARPSALIVCGDQQLVLGQYGRVLQFLRNPWVVAGFVAVAIALPVAIHYADDGSRS
jgi:hypothetical protein